MRKIVSVVAAALLFFALSIPASATYVSFTGTLGIQIGQGPYLPIPLTGGHVARVNMSNTGGHPINYLTIPAGAFATVANTETLTGPVITKFKVPNGISNLSIMVNAGGACTATHALVSCPGGGLAGFGGLTGTLSVIGPANLSVPLSLSKVGAGSSAMNADATLWGAGWTTSSVKVKNTGGVPVLTTTGSLSLNQTTTTFNSDNITLVSPIQIRVSATDTYLPSFAVLTLHLPEPGAAGLALAALATLSGLVGWSRRRNR